MQLEEFQKRDPSFQENMFLSHANEIIKRMFTSISCNQLENIQHFVSKTVYQNLKKEIEEASSFFSRLIYDEIKVSTLIDDFKEIDGYWMIHVTAHCKYLKYYLSLRDGHIVKGNDTVRQDQNFKVVFKKKIGASSNEFRCLGCGITISIHEGGKCPQCGRIFDLELFDYILDSIV